MVSIEYSCGECGFKANTQDAIAEHAQKAHDNPVWVWWYDPDMKVGVVTEDDD